MVETEKQIVPRQPFLLLATKQYQKISVMKQGIAHFYTFRADSDKFDAAEVFPDGCVDIMFRCGKNEPEAVYIGTPDHAYSLENLKLFKKGDTIFGVRFLQGNMVWKKNCTSKDILNAALNFVDVSGQREMTTAICSSVDFEEQIRIFMQHYLSESENEYLHIAQDRKASSYMMKRILDSAGQVRIQELSEELAFSVRHLNEMFREEYGVSPKEYEKIVRFQNILTKLEHAPHIVDAALDAGYYDQSHFLKEFRAIVGITPKAYLKKYHEIATGSRLTLVSENMASYM